MTAAQALASNPAYSAWVSANAGTGKTKVLTDRVLRLLLQGTPPARILCITFTNAAAAEMTTRIQRELSRWAIIEQEELGLLLERLTGATPTKSMLARARRLFAVVLESPEGIRIQTIHSLCQSLLKRFPLEAGTQPHFTVIDERTTMELLKEARMRLFAQCREGGDPLLRKAVYVLSGRYSESTFSDLLAELVKYRRQLNTVLQRPSGIIWLNTCLWQSLGIPYGTTEAQLFEQHFSYAPGEEDSLRSLVAHLAANCSTKSDKKLEECLRQWCEAKADKRHSLLDSYLCGFLTKKNEPLANLLSDAARKRYGAFAEHVERESERVQAFIQERSGLITAQLSEHVMVIAETLLAFYTHLKSTRAFLDYDDLILMTRDLLRRPGIAPWVLYKLDGGLDHVLVDEAQDTSPEQWQIVQTLVEEFFSGKNAREDTRTLFVVGDAKQSIFSFQGADPHSFIRMRDYFAEAVQAAGEGWQSVALEQSFRSTDSVLKAVDAVFAQEDAKQGVALDNAAIHHESTRKGDAGRVELWPLIEPMSQDDFDPWEFPVRSEETDKPSLQMARRITGLVRAWLDEKRLLPSKGRPVKPGDILILVRQRGEFMSEVVRSLKQRGIPVAGVDRVVLTRHIAVMDLLALGNVLLLPEDDLTMATVLKCPLFSFNEEELFALAFGREKKSVWQRLQEEEQRSDKHRQAVAQLRELLDKIDFIAPYELFAYVLEAKGGRLRFVERLGEECIDPLNELLAQALRFEAQFPPSMQGFLNWMEAAETEIKRDLEHQRDEVRVMTVHGSKGLQAPIVFLPDTADKPRFTDRIYWHSVDHREALLCKPPSDNMPPLLKAMYEQKKQAGMEEYRRLLYVAMTRAGDELYIGGWKGKRDKIADDCWYALMESGLRTVMTEQPFQFAGEDEVTIGVLHNPQERDVKPAAITVQGEQAGMPEWLQTMPPEEPVLAQPLTPSRIEGEPVVFSPLADRIRFARGRVLHRLLQYLPDMQPVERQERAIQYLSRHAPEMTAEEQLATANEVLRVISGPEFADFFASGSAAEVPVSGVVQLDNKPFIISGQIDRLRITGDAIWIIDFKTQREAPAAHAIPQAYYKQMRAYAALMQQIYPNHKVHCALLYTSTPVLLPVAV